MRISADFFKVLGYQPLIGREFTVADETGDGAAFVILSQSIWKRRFGADPAIVGKPLTLSGRPFVVVGVLPAGVQHVGGDYRTYPHGESVDIWWPEALPTAPQPRHRGQHYLNVVARLRPGVSIAQAQDDLRRISATLAAHYPKTNEHWSTHLRSLRQDIVGGSETTMAALMAAACAVLLIACLNVAGLLLGRATGRTHEISVRAALGATRATLVRQLITESAILAAIGALLGVGLAYAAVRALILFAPADTPRLHMISVDRIVLAYTLLASTVTALSFGLAPAIQLARTDAGRGLQGGRGAPGGAQQRLRRVLVTAEVALAFALVVTGGLLLRSFATLLRVDPGFRPDHVLTATLTLPAARYSELPASAFFERVSARVGALPGVRAAGFSSDLPWTGYNENTGFGIVGRQFPRYEGPEARYHFLTPGFVHALGLPLVAGRDVSPSDGPNAPPVVLINEVLARRYWGDPRNAIDAKLRLWSDAPTTVVGVVGDLKDVPWAEALPGGVYFAQKQQWYPQDMFLTVRTDADPASLVEPITRIVHEVDPELPITNVRTLDSVAGAALATRRFTLTLVGAFGIAAVFLAIVGIYGVMAQTVGQRVREFGIRQALGAQQGDILRLVLAGGSLMSIVGLLGGIALAIPAARLMRSLLYRTSPVDPVTLVSVAVVLLLAALSASYIPARRATRVDPAVALRQE
jgi:predicted permease